MERVVKRELLDELPPNDPGSVGSRADIRCLNRLMGHAQILGGLLERGLGARSPASLVELGGGDGTFLLTLARRLAPHWPSVEVTLVDCQDVVMADTRRGIEQTGWRLKLAQADVFDWLKADAMPADAMIANLFLHHFEQARLAELLRLASGRTRFFAAAEPRRAWLPLALSRFAWCIGCNAVTRHDIVVSVRAGFAGSDLSRMWPNDMQWQLSERRVGLTTHAFLAVGSRRNSQPCSDETRPQD